MVVFTCPDCNASLKKNKVDEHFTHRKCSADYVTCIDCSKDFHGYDFKQHTICVTEAVKYGAINNAEVSASGLSSSATKTLSWQEQAMENLRIAMESCRRPQLYGVLEFLSAQSNLSRKKGKFINLCKNSLNLCKRAPQLAEEAWQIVDAKPEVAKSDSPMITDTASNGSTSKRPSADNSEDEEIAQVKAKKSKKQKMKEDNMERLNETLDQADLQATVNGSGKFNWRENILSIVSKKGEVSLKKLQKKMNILFIEAEQKPCHEDKFIKKFYARLSSMPEILVDCNTVYLVETEQEEEDVE